MARHNSHEFTPHGIIARMRETGLNYQYIQLAKQFHVNTRMMREMLNTMVRDGLIVAEVFDRRTNYGLTARMKAQDRRSEPRENFWERPPLKQSYFDSLINFRAGCEATRR